MSGHFPHGATRSLPFRRRLVRSVALLVAWAGSCMTAAAQQAASGAPADRSGGFFHDLLHVYTPRRICMEEDAAVVGLHVLSDLLIAASYFSIPVALVVFVRRRRDLAFNWMFLLFASFIFACGMTHVMGVWDIWAPLYKLDGLIKLATGLVSAATAVLLWRLIPIAVGLPSPADLAVANSQLARARDELEKRVEDRTRELEQVSRQERLARDEAERANRAKDEFLATLSHELRTPLNAIVGWTHLLTDGGVESADREKAVAVIERNAWTQKQLIDDMLDMSRIAYGKLRLDVRDVDLDAVIQGALETVLPAANAKQIRLHRVSDPRAAAVRGDPDRLQQVVWNLLSNAVKFTPKGGRVSVVLERVNSHVEISVSDNGPGVPPELLPGIFERFRQDSSTTTRRHGGLGLGLAIVRQLVELHGGSVRVSNVRDGTGAVFTVALPCVPAAAPPEAEPRAHPTAGRAQTSIPAPSDVLAGLNVLVVDDESDTRQLLELLLGRAGARVTSAGSARAALERIDAAPPDVLVSDIGMADQDGYALLKSLRELPASRGGAIPALALTAFARPEDRRLALLAGFQMHLSKPVDPIELVLSVASLAGRGRAPTR